MSESLDQAAAGAGGDTTAPATLAIAADDPQGNTQAKASAAEIEASPGKDEPEAAASGSAAGLLVPVVLAPYAGSIRADAKAAQGSTLAGNSSASSESEAAAAPRAAASETPLKFIPFQTLPPRQKKVGSRFGEFWFKAAAVAVAVGIGWIAGANTFDRGKEVHSLAAQLDATQAKLADVARAARVGQDPNIAALKRDFATLKQSVDGLSKTLDAQRAGLGATKASLDSARSDLDSVKTALQAAQAGLAASKPDAAKLDRLGERIDRLEHQYSALMPTGSIASTSAAPATGQSASVAERDPHVLPSKQQRAAVERPKIPPNGYVLRYVHGGVAVIEDRTGLHEVFPGEVLAGIGRVESIEQRGRRWVVVTSDGLIDSDPY